MLESSWERHDDAHDHDNGSEADGTHGVVGQGVEDLGASENVKADEEDVVGEQHESSELVRKTALAKGIVSKVANISDLRVFHDELVHGDGGDPEKNAGNDHCDYSWYPSENARPLSGCGLAMQQPDRDSRE